MSIIARRVGESIAANMGCLPELMSLKQLWAVQARWRSVFAEGLHQASGRWVMEKCDWDVFSRGYFPCLRGENARRAYAEVSPASILHVTSAWARSEIWVRLRWRATGPFGGRPRPPRLRCVFALDHGLHAL